jgi:predicted transcriptional regulator
MKTTSKAKAAPSKIVLKAKASSAPPPAQPKTAAKVKAAVAKPPPLKAPKASAAPIPPKPVRKDRWPESVMARGYTMVPSILLWGQGALGLKPDEFNVLLQLVSHWWTKSQNPHPSKETIARRMGKNARTVQRHLTTLENAGFIKRETRFKLHKGQDSNGYDLRGLVKKLKEIAPDFEKVADQNKRRRARAEAKK